MDINVLNSICIFILGLVFGSFYNVVGYRLPNNMSIAFPASHCPNCNHKLKFYELIPVLSYIFLKGKCSSCKKRISIFYPFFELLTAILFTISYLIFGFNLKFLIALVFISVLIIVSISDLKYFIIPDEALIFGSIIMLIIYIINTFTNDIGIYKGIIMPLLNGAASFALLYLFKVLGDTLFKKESLGGGDIKLLFFIGLTLGFDMAIVTIFLAAFIALPISIISLIKNDNNILPFGPYLSIASIIILLTNLDLNTIMNFFIK